MNKEKDIFEVLLNDISNTVSAPVEAVKKDFDAFSNAIDELIAKEHISEDEAITKVFASWEFNFNR